MGSDVNLTIFYDNPEYGHNPAHFRQVYGELLPEAGIATKVIYFIKSGVKGEDVILRGGAGLLGTIFRVILLPYGMLKLQRRLGCFAPGRVVLVHNDPLVVFFSLLFRSIYGGSVLYRITQLKTEEVMQFYGPRVRWLFSIHRWLRNRAVEQVDHTILMSTSMLQYIYISTKVDFSKLSILESYVDASMSTNWQSKKVKDCLREVEIGSEKCMVYVGNISRYRDNDFLFDVLDYVRAVRSDVKLLVIASGSEGEVSGFSNLIFERGATDSVILLPNLEETVMRAVLLNIDGIGLSPYNYKQNRVLICNSPVKTLDYLNAGIYVVASNIPENESILSDEKLGVAIECCVSDFGEAVLKAIERRYDIDGKAERKEWVKLNRDVAICSQSLSNIVGVIKRFNQSGE